MPPEPEAGQTTGCSLAQHTPPTGPVAAMGEACYHYVA